MHLLYERMYRWFDEHRSRCLFEKPILDQVISYLNPDAKILDIGCGMGEPIAQYFIKNGFSLTGIDGSKKLIALARKRFPSAKFMVKDMRHINLEDKFDCIILWHSLFHLTAEDQRAMFPRFIQHLKDDGILVFTSGDYENEVWSDNGGEDLYHASLSPEEYKSLIKAHNLDLLYYTLKDPAYGDASVWISKLRRMC